jgi:predicted hydrolase (HD superfamily)
VSPDRPGVFKSQQPKPLNSRMASHLKARRETPQMDGMSREQTLEFLRNHVKTEMLMKHLYAVERLHAQLRPQIRRR